MTSLTERQTIVGLVADAVKAGATQARACEVISLSERTLQRWQKDQQQSIKGDRRCLREQRPANALSDEERKQLLGVIHSDEFRNLSPNQIVPILADRGKYLASESTFYRVMRAEKLLKHRHKQTPIQVRKKPRAICASGPSQVFTWDITYLPTRIKGIYFYLYLFIDIYSRKVVGWQVYDQECNVLASDVIRDICEQENIPPDQLILHSDNGGPMKGATMLATLQNLGVATSFSRPAVSNDNPFSESFFKTMKYQHMYPQKPFNNLLEARQWVETFVTWYNHEHRHSSISYTTPAQRHEGVDKVLLAKRHELYLAAKTKNPKRWSGATRNWKPVNIVYLNPDKNKDNHTNTQNLIQDLQLAA